MSFHAITVRAFRDGQKDEKFDPKNPLLAIRGWVENFFGCENCRQHFMKMTTKSMKLEDNVNKPEDAFMYLWRAHNTVNSRLKGKETEDPKYPKVQFPAPFLCKECHVGGDQKRDDKAVQEYLINYYSNIRPRGDETGKQLNEADE